MVALHPTILIGFGDYGRRLLRQFLADAHDRGVLQWEDPPQAEATAARRVKDLVLITVDSPSGTDSNDEGIAKDLYAHIQGLPAPSQEFFSAAVEQDRELLEYANDRKVILSSPTTFLALLHAVAQGWQQEKLAENAREIAARGKELHARLLVFLEHLEKLRLGLDRANRSYNDAVGSLESRLLPAARKFQALAAPGGEELPPLAPIETLPRQISVPQENDE